MAAPTLERIVPEVFRQGDLGVIAAIHGRDFAPGARVEFSSGVDLRGMEVVSATEIRVTLVVPASPAPPETGTVTVCNPVNQVSMPLTYRIEATEG